MDRQAGDRERACPLCGGREHAVRFAIPEKRVLIVQCPACGLVFTRPSAGAGAAPDEIYRRAYFEGGDRPGDAPSFEDRERILRLKWERELFPRIESRRPGKGRLLDVGCATGILADAAARRGWQAQGLEISAYAADLARTRFGIPVTCSGVETAEFPAGTFDAVTLIHTLEHVAEPVETLRRIFGWLRPGGLVAVEVPNIESRPSRRQGPRWPMLRPEEHLVHFSPRTIRAVLEKAGFVSIAAEEAGGTGLLDALHRRGFRRLRGLILRNLRFLSGAGSLVLKAFRLTAGAETILAIAQKPEP